jgi:FixJ family two-component response regulator
MDKKKFKVLLIDDDEEILQSISLLLKSVGYSVECFKVIEQFLERENYTGAGCILLDVFLKGKSGLELQEVLETKFDCLPIIFITGRGSIPMSVKAMKKGALSFLQKPIDEKELFKVIEEAFDKSNALVTKHDEIEKVKSLVNSLTAREYEIFCYLITGMPNKQIAYALNVSENTIKNHRLKITEKLGVKSVAEKIYIAEKLNIKGATINHSSR